MDLLQNYVCNVQATDPSEVGKVSSVQLDIDTTCYLEAHI